MNRRWAISISGLSMLCCLTAYGANRADEINRKRHELSQTEQQISRLNSEATQQEQRTAQLQSQVNAQQALVLDLGRQSVELQAQDNRTQMSESLGAQENRINQSVVLGQLQDDVARQEGITATLRARVREQDARNISADSYDQDRAQLQIEQERLNNARYQYNSAQARSSLDRDGAVAQNTQNLINRKAASQSLAQQEAEAQTTAQRLQAELKSQEDQASRTRTDLTNLERKRETLADELDNLTSATGDREEPGP